MNVGESRSVDWRANGKLPIIIGETPDGVPHFEDLAEIHHLLIGGITGSPVLMEACGTVLSLLEHTTPDEVRMLIIDTHNANYRRFRDVPHLYAPPFNDPLGGVRVLKWLVGETRRRLKLFEAASARDIGSYNEAVTNKEHGDEYGPGTMPVPRIVVVVDDLADLMIYGGCETEQALAQLAQESGAVGIHLIVSTRRLTANVLTGTILNAFSHRVALQVSSSVESRVLTGMPDAKELDSKSMLFVEFENRSLKSSLRLKVQYFDSDFEDLAIGRLFDFTARSYLLEAVAQQPARGVDISTRFRANAKDDPLLWDAAKAVIKSGDGSVSTLARKLRIDYARARRLMDALEEKGVVGPSWGASPREVLLAYRKDTGSPQNAWSSPGLHVLGPALDNVSFSALEERDIDEHILAILRKASKFCGSSPNPLILCGKSRTGKTLCLAALAHEVRRGYPSSSIVYTSGHAFSYDYTAAIRGKTEGEFEEKYASADLLLIDDADNFSERYPPALSSVLNKMVACNKQVVLAFCQYHNALEVNSRLLKVCNNAQVLNLGIR